MVDLLGNLLGGHVLDNLESLILVELHEHVGGGLLVEELEDIFGPVGVELLYEFGKVGGV